jgi:hypothetical protein
LASPRDAPAVVVLDDADSLAAIALRDTASPGLDVLPLGDLDLEGLDASQHVRLAAGLAQLMKRYAAVLLDGGRASPAVLDLIAILCERILAVVPAGPDRDPVADATVNALASRRRTADGLIVVGHDAC